MGFVSKRDIIYRSFESTPMDSKLAFRCRSTFIVGFCKAFGLPSYVTYEGLQNTRRILRRGEETRAVTLSFTAEVEKRYSTLRGAIDEYFDLRGLRENVLASSLRRSFISLSW